MNMFSGEWPNIIEMYDKVVGSNALGKPKKSRIQSVYLVITRSSKCMYIRVLPVVRLRSRFVV